MEVQWGEVVAICEVEREGRCPLAVVAGLPHCVDLGDGEVDGLPALWRREGLWGAGKGKGKGMGKEGGEEKEGEEEEGEGKGGRKGKTHVPSYTGHACSDTTLTHQCQHIHTIAISQRYSHIASIRRVLSS